MMEIYKELKIALEKMELAYSLASDDQKNATQLARTVQKAAANPPHNSDPIQILPQESKPIVFGAEPSGF